MYNKTVGLTFPKTGLRAGLDANSELLAPEQ